MHTSYTKISLFLLILSSFMPAQAILSSLSLWNWQPDGKNIELFLMGDYYTQNPEQTIIATADQSHFSILQNALRTWNSLDDMACLLESNQWVTDFNNKQLKKRSPLAYISMYFTLANYIEQNKQKLDTIDFHKCDTRGPAFYKTKFAFEMLRDIIEKILKQNPRARITKDALQQITQALLKIKVKVSAQTLLDELTQGAETIRNAIASQESTIDEITQTTLHNYLDALQQKMPMLQLFFQQNLAGDLGKTTLEALINHITKSAQLDVKNLENRAEALLCIQESLKVLDEFNRWFEKITNYVADAGFILALQHHKKTANKKLAFFVSNNHAVALNEYLQKYQQNKQAQAHFRIGNTWQYSLEKSADEVTQVLMPEPVKVFFSIPFNDICDKAAIRPLAENFQNNPLEAFKQVAHLTQAFVCSEKSCPKISIDKRFDICRRCKNAHYCSVACQKRDWKNRHKSECKPVAPQN